MQKKVQDTPKPLKLEFTDNKFRAVFNTDELRRFVQDNDDAAFLIDVGRERRTAILIQPIREFFERDKSAS